ncbi:MULTISPECIES: polysaccharide deacetylase family protein [unclassified Devosia]|uniref:polysaccharide deacetylase family protein n=1 Tax=unclassified Devosia TaxID=196773 RepID=UPI0015564C87|nr:MULTISPECIES: polysaccharide deacetylase family protein [unclassified Devosia]
MRRWIILLATMAVLVAGFLGVLELSNAKGFQLFGDIVARLDTDAPVVALTLDDGPTPAYTQTVLDILNERDVKATFFLTGRESAEHPQQVQAIAAAGHEIGNHSWSHKRMVFMSPASIAEEIESTDVAIRKTGYAGPLHFRPPYGKKLVALPWYLAQHGRTTIMWDVEPEADAADAASPQGLADHAIANATNGSIIIMHVMYESRAASRLALPPIIDGLKARGFKFVTVSQLLAGR